MHERRVKDTPLLAGDTDNTVLGDIRKPVMLGPTMTYDFGNQRAGS